MADLAGGGGTRTICLQLTFSHRRTKEGIDVDVQDDPGAAAGHALGDR